MGKFCVLLINIGDTVFTNMFMSSNYAMLNIMFRFIVSCCAGHVIVVWQTS